MKYAGWVNGRESFNKVIHWVPFPTTAPNTKGR